MDTGLRDYFNIEQQVLDPEKAVNWSIGFDYTPTGNFLTGLNLQATYYIVKINGILRNFGNPTDERGSTIPSIGFAFVTPEDLRDPVTDAQLCAGQNATPVAVRAIPGHGAASARPSGKRSPVEASRRWSTGSTTAAS